VTGAGQTERVEGVNVSFSYFSMLGVTPQLGRLFGPQDFVPGLSAEAVISDGLWRRAYGADPHVVGHTIQLDNDPLTIIGVLPRGFRHPGPTTSFDSFRAHQSFNNLANSPIPHCGDFCGDWA
jgi:hypothetical protein